MDIFLSLIHHVPLALGPSWLDPESLIEKFSMIGLLIIVFMESGMMVGFFLPGDLENSAVGPISAKVNCVQSGSNREATAWNHCMAPR